MSSIDSHINRLISEECTENSLHEALSSRLPELATKWKNKINGATDTKIINKVLQTYYSKIQEGCDVKDVMENMITLFNFTPEDTLQYNNIWSDIYTTAQSQYTSNPQYGTMITKLLGAYKPAQGINGCTIYKDRIQKQTNNYIRRVNGENVQIDQLIHEMKALYNIDEALETELHGFFESYKEGQDVVSSPETPNDTPTEIDSKSVVPDSTVIQDGVANEEQTDVPDVVTFDQLEESMHNIVKKMCEACETCDPSDIKETVYNAIRVCENAKQYGDPTFIDKTINVINEDGVYGTDLMEELKGILEKYYAEAYEKDTDLSINKKILFEMFCRDEEKEEIDIEIFDDIIKPQQKVSNRMLRFFIHDD